MENKNRLKEIQKLFRNIEKLSNGQARISSWDCDKLDQLDIEVKPTDGCYEGAKFEFKVRLSNGFPNTAPVVQCKTFAYHPNIDPYNIIEDDDDDESTNVCFSMFESANWNSSYGLEGCILGLLFLIQNPNLEDPLSELVDDNITEQFEINVRKSLAGKAVGGTYFWEFANDNMDTVCNSDEENNNDEQEEEEAEIEHAAQSSETCPENKCEEGSVEDNYTKLETDDNKPNQNENTLLSPIENGNGENILSTTKETDVYKDVPFITDDASNSGRNEDAANGPRSTIGADSENKIDIMFSGEVKLNDHLPVCDSGDSVNTNPSAHDAASDWSHAEDARCNNESEVLAVCACAMDVETELNSYSTKKGLKRGKKEIIVVEDMLVECDELCADPDDIDDMDVSEVLTLSKEDSVTSLILPRLNEGGAVDFEKLLYKRIGILTE